MNSTFSGNTGAGVTGATGASGSRRFDAVNGATGGAALGGGVFNLIGTLTATNCTFVLNSVTGGKGGLGGVPDDAGFGRDGGNGGEGRPPRAQGSTPAPGGQTWIVNCTLSDNRLQAGTGGLGGAGTGIGRQGKTGGVGQQFGGAICNADGVLRLRNSILAYSVSGPNAGGTIADEGFNLSSDSTPVLFAEGSRNRDRSLARELDNGWWISANDDAFVQQSGNQWHHHSRWQWRSSV